MFDEENARLRLLLKTTIFVYVFSLICGFIVNKLLYDENYFSITSSNLFIPGILTFLSMSWIPLSIFLFFQARILKKKIKFEAAGKDLSVISLSTAMPLVMFFIYIFTRIVY